MAFKKKIEINPQIRLIVLSREQLRAIAELFLPYKGYMGGVIKSFIESTALTTSYADLSKEKIPTPSDKEKRGVIGLATKRGIKVDNSVQMRLVNRPRLRGILGHEAEHMLGKALPQIAGRNHLATASAISFYLEEIANGNWPSIKGLSAEEEQLLRDAFTRHALNDAVNRHENLRNAEYLEFSAGKSLNDAGHTLGRFALRQERLTHLPGVGMFVIRDISIGVGQSEVEAKVARGAYEKERRHWLQKNPSVKRYLMRVFYRWRKASTEIILRAKQRPSKKPLARKRMQRRLK